MASRLRLRDFMLSDGPQQIGLQGSDVVRCASAVNAAQERLRFDEAFGDEGPPGSWAEVAISVPITNPYVTVPRGIASLAAIDVCNRPVPLNNQFFEYLEFGTGRFPKSDRWNGLVQRCGRPGAFTRNYAPTLSDLSGGPQQIMVVAENVNDCVPSPVTGAVPRVLVQGTCHGVPIVTQDGVNTVQGEFVTLTQPFALTNNLFDPPALTGIQKDATMGNVQIWQSDPWWGSAEIISIMEPSEQVGWHRRYYIDRLPPGCCPYRRGCRTVTPSPPVSLPVPPCPTPSPLNFVQVTALARLDLVSAVCDSDYLLIQSLEAIKQETMAGYMYGMQDTSSKQQAALYHKRAIQILIGQSYVEEGKNNVASNVAIFGKAGWGRVNLGMQ
jgi:hypothetical protein